MAGWLAQVDLGGFPGDHCSLPKDNVTGLVDGKLYWKIWSLTTNCKGLVSCKFSGTIWCIQMASEHLPHRSRLTHGPHLGRVRSGILGQQQLLLAMHC